MDVVKAGDRFGLGAAVATKYSLASVLADGYFDTLTDVRLLKEDTISLVASYGAERAEHAVLVVDEADKHGKARVSLLHRYERSQ